MSNIHSDHDDTFQSASEGEQEEEEIEKHHHTQQQQQQHESHNKEHEEITQHSRKKQDDNLPQHSSNTKHKRPLEKAENSRMRPQECENISITSPQENLQEGWGHSDNEDWGWGDENSQQIQQQEQFIHNTNTGTNTSQIIGHNSAQVEVPGRLENHYDKIPHQPERLHQAAYGQAQNGIDSQERGDAEVAHQNFDASRPGHQSAPSPDDHG